MKIRNTCRRTGQHRFWHPIDSRYRLYSWPKNITVKCSKCGEKLDFEAIVPELYSKDEISGGYTLVIQQIATEIRGQGACTNCGRQSEKILWPENAYYQFIAGGGRIWAWNIEYLKVLRVRVAGDRVLERQLCMKDGLYRYFLSRLPKYVVVKRHREGILGKLDRFIVSEESWTFKS